MNIALVWPEYLANNGKTMIISGKKKYPENLISDLRRETVQTLRASQSALGKLPSVVEARGSCKRADPRVGGFGIIMSD